MRRLLLSVAAVAALCSPLQAQGLRGQISQLFIFGPGEDPLFLSGTADPGNPSSIQVHGTHFIPAAVTSNGTVISFVTSAISTNVADFPFSSASGGTTFRFEGGVPVATSTSPGPVFAERAQTLGRGRALVGLAYSSFRYATLRGVPLNDVQLTFTHENVTGPECDSVVSAAAGVPTSCGPMGVPVLENDIMPFTLALDIRVAVTTFVLTYGLSDRLDVGVAIPLVGTTLTGHSRAQIIPFGGPTAAHFFTGAPDNPGLSADRFVQGSASGLGDVAVRVKLNLHSSTRSGVAVLADGRFPTGSQNDLLGAGRFSGRVVGVLSNQFGSFASHANVGYLYRAGNLRNDAVVATAGFDQQMSPWATFVADVISQWQVGDNKLTLPGDVTITQPFLRTVQTSDIPDIRDDLVNASLGFKFTLDQGPTVITNALFPLNRGGLRPNVLYTVGVEYSF